MSRVWFLVWLAVLGSAESARALTFNVTFDASTNNAPAGFFTAFNNAIAFYQALYTDPIVINIHVGWGDINGNPLNPGLLGQSLTAQPGNFTYAQVRTALINDAKTPQDAAATAGLPASDPTFGNFFTMSNAEAKALGLLAANNAAIDGWVGFSATAAWTFDPTNRAVSGKVDFIAIAHHEITEVMGRYGYGQNGSGSRNSPIDLFRFTSPGSLSLSPAYSSNDSTANYFSIDGGQTNIHNFNVVCCGDLSDWASGANDAFNASSAGGVKNPTSEGDLRLMDVLGYDRVQFTDSTLTAGVTAIKATHLTEMRSRTDGLLTRLGLAAFSYTDPSVSAGTTIIKTVHVTDLRTALSQAYVATGKTTPTFTDSTLTAASSLIKAVHITELRGAVADLESDGESFVGAAIPSTSMGSATDHSGCQYAISASGTFAMQISTDANGNITGESAGLQNVGIVVTFTPPNTSCSASPFTSDLIGTVSGTNASLTTVASDARARRKFTFNGSRTGNTLTGSLTIFATTSDGVSDFTFTQTISSYTLTKQ